MTPPTACRAARLMLTAAMLAALSACAPTPALIDAGIVAAPEPKLFADAYTARDDGEFDVPALPVDKIPVQYQRQEVYFPTEETPGTIIIDPAQRTLHLVTGSNTATRYGIGVGKAGFEWSGEALITARKTWPTWTPPKEMIERKPELSKWEDGQPGGPENPLGARALYLTTNGVDYGYRIHGTPEWNTIGTNASSGCIRMINQDVMDLYNRVPDGAKVVVLNADGTMPTKLTLPPPAPKKPKKSKPAPTPVAAADIPDAPVVPDVGTPDIAMPDLPAPPPLDPELVGPISVDEPESAVIDIPAPAP